RAEPRHHDHLHRSAEGFRIRTALRYAVAESLQQPRDLPHAPGHLVIDLRARANGEADPQLAVSRRGGVREPAVELGPVRIAGKVAGDGVEPSRRIRDGAGDHAVRREPGPMLAE